MESHHEKPQKHFRYRAFFASVIIVCAILLVIGVVCEVQLKRDAYNNSVTIILSPHFDDAVLSLGGLMAKQEHPTTVATFFMESPEVATSTPWDKNSGFANSTEAEAARIQENTDALKVFNVTEKNYAYPDNQYGRTETNTDMQNELSQDIQALLASYEARYNGKEINIYGPAYFTDSINHPDHILLHAAYVDVARDYPENNVHFFIYEDYPYVEGFMKESVMSLQKNLENETGLFFDQQEISLSPHDVSQKIESLKKYSSQTKAFAALGEDIITGTRNFTNTRCEVNPEKACEVVYEIQQ